jgi:general nucleoside transport system permease protein
LKIAILLPMLIGSMFRMSVALFIPSLGEMISEKAGITNVSVEGYMLFGALSSYLVAVFTQNAWLGLLTGIIVGTIISAIHAYMSITIKTNQFISGMSIWLFAVAVTSFYWRVISDKVGYIKVAGFNPINIPALSNIPFLGEAFFKRDILFYIALLLVVAFYFLLYKTNYGLLIRAAGDNPLAVDLAGYSVQKIRYSAVLICGAMSGFGGAYLPLSIVRNFGENLIAGRGFICLCIVILGRWNPFGVLAGSLVFAFVDALQMSLMAMNSPIPYPFLQMLPYLVTIIALIGMGPLMKRAEPPRYLNLPYEKGQV